MNMPWAWIIPVTVFQLFTCVVAFNRDSSDRLSFTVGTLVGMWSLIFIMWLDSHLLWK